VSSLKLFSSSPKPAPGRALPARYLGELGPASGDPAPLPPAGITGARHGLARVTEGLFATSLGRGSRRAGKRAQRVPTSLAVHSAPAVATSHEEHPEPKQWSAAEVTPLLEQRVHRSRVAIATMPPPPNRNGMAFSRGMSHDPNALANSLSGEAFDSAVRLRRRSQQPVTPLWLRVIHRCRWHLESRKRTISVIWHFRAPTYSKSPPLAAASCRIQCRTRRWCPKRERRAPDVPSSAGAGIRLPRARSRRGRSMWHCRPQGSSTCMPCCHFALASPHSLVGERT
jgi:hypothetical protein